MNLAFDEVWCVHDVDDHPKLDEVFIMARDNGILLAVSNPCFELWLLLHFRDAPGPRHRRELMGLLKKFLEHYDKTIRFADVWEGYDAAVTRASRLDAAAELEGRPCRNPTTGVWRLTQSIRGDRFVEDE